VFCNGQATFETNPVVWDDAAILENLGYIKAQIDATIASLITKFSQTTAQILADETIESEFAVIKAVIDARKNV
jgi:hypothetical protein